MTIQQSGATERKTPVYVPSGRLRDVPHYVYVAVSERLDLPVKIGCSAYPSVRAKKAKIAFNQRDPQASPKDFVLFDLAYAQKFNNNKQARDVETTAIELLRDRIVLDIGEEWFSISKEEAIEVVIRAAEMVAAGHVPASRDVIRVFRRRGNARLSPEEKKLMAMGEKIRQRMKAMGIKCPQMARMLGVRVKDIERIGRCGCQPDVNLMMSVRLALDMTLSLLKFRLQLDDE